jgi:Flp pilus assembly protein TadB
MPFLLGIGMFIFKPTLMKPFVCSLIGGITLIGVVFLVAIGGLIIRKIVTIDV